MEKYSFFLIELLFQKAGIKIFQPPPKKGREGNSFCKVQIDQN